MPTGGGFSLDLGNLMVHLRLDQTQFHQAIRKSTAAMQNAAETFTAIGRKMTLGVTVPLTAMGYAAVRTMSKMEDAFIGVEKTVNATSEELSNLRNEFEQMSLAIPVTATELFRVGEAAGQLGIRTDNIASFSKVMAELGITTNMTATTAATALARLANITQMSQDRFDQLGATIVDLGNNSATTEAEIVNMAMRVAGAGTSIGLTEHQILSFSAAMSSVGIRAEAGGTAFTRVMNEMAKAVSQGSSTLRQYANVAGMTVKEFKFLFENDAANALLKFIKGLGYAVDEGENVAVIMERLGLEGIRVSDVMNRLAGAGELVGDSLAIGAKAWKENIALTEEAEKRYKSFTSQLQITQNYVALVLKSIGAKLAPTILNLNELVEDAAKWWNRLSDETQGFIVKAGAAAAAIGPLALGMSGLLLTMRGMMLLAVPFKKLWTGLVASFALLNSTLMIVVGSLYLIYALFSQNIANYGRDLKILFKGYKAGFMYMANVTKEFVTYVSTIWLDLFNGMDASVESFVVNFGASMASAKQWVTSVLTGQGLEKAGQDWAKAFVQATERGEKRMSHLKGAIVDTFETATVWTKAMGMALGESTVDVAAAVSTQIKQDFDALAKGLASISPVIADMMSAARPQLINDLQGAGPTQGPQTEAEALGEGLESLSSKSKTFKERIIGDFKAIKKWYTEWTTDFPAKFDEMLSETAVMYKNWWNDFQATIWEGSDYFNNAMTSMVDGFANAITDMLFEGKSLEEGLKQVFRSIAQEAFNQAMRMMIFKAMSSMFGGFGAAASAKGNVFQNGSIQRFDNGGVVTKSSAFPMNGGIGTLAENNKPEAIMPLERDNQGKLGVRSTGEDRSEINVKNVNILDTKTVTDAMESRMGEKTILNIMRRNYGALKMMGG